MPNASSAEAQRDFGTCREIAEGADGELEVVAVPHDNKPSVVIVSAREYARLKRRDKLVRLTEDLPEPLIDRMAAGAYAFAITPLRNHALTPNMCKTVLFPIPLSDHNPRPRAAPLQPGKAFRAQS